jgi:hypothetical protein
MTPKEKAKELIELFQTVVITAFEYDSFCMTPEEAKQCALIAVDEILKVAAPIIDINEDYFKELRADQTQYYWQQVKTEIQLL